MQKDTLPNNINSLKNIIFDNNKTIIEQEKNLLKKEKDISQRDLEIQNLMDTIKILQRRIFAPTSEVSDKQFNLFNEAEELNQTDDQATETEDVDDGNGKTKKKRKKGKRKPIADSLPRVDKIIELSELEREGMKEIGEEVSEKLVIQPAKVHVERTIRKKYAPIDKESDKKITVAPAPKELLPKTMASASLIAYILTAKFVDAMPLYRQEKIFERISAMLTRQTMARWIIKTSSLVMPLYNLLQEKCLDSQYLQMDETTLQVLKQKNRKPTSKSYMWLRHAPGANPIILFDYDATRSGEVPIRLLEGFSGALQVDGYDGYAPACNKYNLKRLGCMDHCRRKFFFASKTSGGKNIGKKAISLIDKLYKIEKNINNLSPEDRYRIRQEQSVPILNKIKEWINEIRPKITTKSVAGKAINYAFNEWTYLSRYVENEKYNISNIWVENAVRPFAVGRKNWLFSASVAGAEASAMFFSLIETAKKNGLEPFDYLSKMLEKLPFAETADDYEKLLPLKNCFQA